MMANQGEIVIGFERRKMLHFEGRFAIIKRLDTFNLKANDAASHSAAPLPITRKDSSYE